MKMRFLAFFLTLCLMFTMVPANVFAVTFDGQDGVGEVISTVSEEDPSEPEVSAEPETLGELSETETPSEPSEPEEPSEPVIPGEGCTAHEDGMHVHEAVVTAPTCTEQGYTTYTCPCGDTYVADYVDATGHNMENGTCTNCGVCELPIPVATATNIDSTGKIKVTWNAIEGAVSYKVYRSEAVDGVYEHVFTATRTKYNNTGAVAGKTYYYKVIAVDANGEAVSQFSEIVSCTCKYPRLVVTASNIESSGKIALTWEAVEGAVSYKVYRAEAKDGVYENVFTATRTKYNNTGAVAGKTYYYKVIALDVNGEEVSRFSKVVSCTCTLARPVVTASNIESTGKIKLTWDEVEGAVSYVVYRSTEKDGTYKKMLTTTYTRYTNTSAQVDSTYYYKVMAVAENSEANSALSAAKKRVTDCAQPIITSAAPDEKNGKPRIYWESVEGAVAYKVYRSTSLDGTYKLMYTSNSNTYNNTGAALGKTYYYKVKAVGVNSASASAYSTTVAVMAASKTYDYVYATYTTTKSGSAERNTNLYLACKAINGTIVAPGELFSFNEIVGPRTAAKGYQLAPVVGGTGRGGGICQVSTTLFNVALLGNLKIAKRFQHSVAVTYVPYGRDAMIYKTANDFKFVNDSPYFIKVVASSSNGVVKISFMTREPNVSPSSDVTLPVTYSNGTYTLNRYYKGQVNYTATSKYK